MLFDSTAYILFLILATLVYWCLPFRKQNYMLLAASYFFYGWWDWRFLILMAVSTVVDYLVAHKIAASSDERTRRFWLLFSLILNFSFLGICFIPRSPARCAMESTKKLKYLKTPRKEKFRMREKSSQKRRVSTSQVEAILGATR